MDLYPDTTRTDSNPSGVVSRGSIGWYNPPVLPNGPVNLDALRPVRGTAGVLQTPPESQNLSLAEDPPPPTEIDIRRGAMRPNMGGLNA